MNLGVESKRDQVFGFFLNVKNVPENCYQSDKCLNYD